MVEYGLIVGCIALACIAALTGMGVSINDVLWGPIKDTIFGIVSSVSST